MTRINLVPPSELTDQHLIAEYREIFMVAGSLRRTLLSKNGFQESRVPKKYTLNKGHVYFFYNKGQYLHKRYLDLILFLTFLFFLIIYSLFKAFFLHLYSSK